MIGYMGNNLLPARAGEVARAVALSRTTGAGVSRAVASVLSERIVDVFALVVLLWIALATSPPAPWLARANWTLLVGNGLLLAAVLVLERRRERARAWLERLPERWRRRSERWCESFLDGFAALRSPRVLLATGALSAGVWIFALWAAALCLDALGLHLPRGAAVMALVSVVLASMIPSAPAYLGTIQYACILALGLFGVGRSDALAFSILYHATQLLPVTILGALFLAWDHGGWSTIRQRMREVRR
jgi:hypothetical protein